MVLDHPKIESEGLVCIASRNIHTVKAFMGIISISDGKIPRWRRGKQEDVGLSKKPLTLLSVYEYFALTPQEKGNEGEQDEMMWGGGGGGRRGHFCVVLDDASCEKGTKTHPWDA